MKINFLPIFRVIIGGLALLTTLFSHAQTRQTLSIKDFAIWGGSSAPVPLQQGQGVYLKGKVTVNGNVGSNHLVEMLLGWTVNGHIYSANKVDLKGRGQIKGNIFAWKSDQEVTEPSISGLEGNKFTGNLTSGGKVNILSGNGANQSSVTGIVAVPAPGADNYSGPVPTGGIITSPEFPVLPVMPGLAAFNNLNGNLSITKTRVVMPGVYKNIDLKGGQRITFRGPGNYVFEEINATGNNNTFIFDLNNTTQGTINIYVKKNARFGKTMVSAMNGTQISRVYTEVHGDGADNNGIAFEVEARGALGPNNYIWLGNVWAPNGGISIKGGKPQKRPHIIGALWSGKRVEVTENTILSYDAPATENISYIEPYYQPPVSGKVEEPANIIGAELTSLTQNPNPITSIPDNEIFRLDDQGNVMIEVISKQPNDNVLKQQLLDMGMTDTIGNGPHSYIITGFFPISLLPQLNTNPLIEYVRPLYPPVNNRGQVTTQGDKTMKTNLVRERFGLDGSGIKIGVLSDSYNNTSRAQDDIDQGDLPGEKSSGETNPNAEMVQILQDLRSGGKDEGRAMLQIVHDIAPNAKLAFRTGFLSAGDFAKGILELADPALPGGKCDIIVDDLSYITEPFFRDGVVAKTVDQVVSQGVTYFTSAGNFGKRSYEAVFNGVTNTEAIPAPAQVHQFGSNSSQVYQSILLKPGNYTIVLQWDDEFHSLGEDGVQTDLDLYLVGTNGFKLFGFNRSNVFKDPFEVCPFTVKEETVAKVMIVRASGTNNVRFKYIIFRGDATILDYPAGTSTIVGHANSNGAISVGAMLYDSIPGVTTTWPGVASFSSRGGTFTLENNAFITRNKPDIIAPNGVNTTVNLGGAVFNDGDPYPNFFGTSAAAPHAAGVGALILQGRKKFNQETSVSPQVIRQQLINNAVKFPYLGNSFTFEGGHGYIQADLSLLEIANARPIIDTMYAETPGGELGSDPFTVVVKGRYLTSSTQIYVNEAAVASQVLNNGTEVRATVPDIPDGEDPSFQLFNPAKSPSGEDGGFSEKKYFFSEKAEVIIKPNNKTRKYGQDNPNLDVSITIDGVPIEETDLTAAELMLDPSQLVVTTLANPQSRAGQYGIFVERATELLPEDPLNNRFNFLFKSGTLNIQKLPLTIIPEYKTIKFGEFPGDNITYRYIFDIDGDGINDGDENGDGGEEGGEGGDETASMLPSEFLAEIKRLHKEHMAENGIIVIRGFNHPDNTLTIHDLYNLSSLASFQSVINGKKYILENGQLKALVNEIASEEIGNQRFILETPLSSLLNYIDDPSSATLDYVDESTLNYSGLLNLKALAKGEASASIPNGQLRAMVNGQLMGMVNGELEAVVNGQLRAMINGTFYEVDDIVFKNGQLRALINGNWEVATNGQLRAMVNGTEAEFDLSVLNGQLRAMVNGDEMQLVNGQLRAMVNGQNVSIINGQLRAMVNSQLVPLVNNELVGIVNGQLRAMVNGQAYATVNGQLLAVVDGELEEITELTLINGQLRALINGQLRALINGQLKAMVNGALTDIDNNELTMVNGQLRAMINGQLRALINGQLKALVNGQLKALVNSESIAVEKVILQNGQLRALINGNYVPIKNGQLRAMVNGQLRAMVNGELMAVVNGEVTFTIFQNGQLKALVNGEFEPFVNGQLRAMVNGSLEEIESYTIANGQLRAMVNGEEWVYPNGQLKALVNGQLKALVNNFDISGDANNARTMVLVDEDDLVKQEGDIGGMFSMPMITGLDAGYQTIIPAAFINENFEVSYEWEEIEILPAPVFVKTGDTSKVYGDPNPVFTNYSISELAYDDSLTVEPYNGPLCDATDNSPVGLYPIYFDLWLSGNYRLVNDYGNLTILPKVLTVTAENKSVTKGPGAVLPALTIDYDGLVGDDTEDSVCVSYIRPASPKVIDDYDRTTTYTGVTINGGSNVFFAAPGQTLLLEGQFVSYNNPSMICPGCITQLHIGMGDAGGNYFTTCYEATISGSTGNITQYFNAPSNPGVYYITQAGTWWYYCGQFPSPGQYVTDINKFAIAVVIVTSSGASEDKITATVDVDPVNDPTGDYPITLDACANFNPNYTVVLVNGTLTLQPECVPDTHYWKAEGDFSDENGTGNGTPSGGVFLTSDSYAGSGAFQFLASSNGYISTGTGGSVSGKGDFSVSAWVKTTSNMPMVVIAQRDESNIDGEYILKIGGSHGIHDLTPSDSGKAYFMMFSFEHFTAFELMSDRTVNDGEWHFIKAERLGTTLNLYVDGTLEATTTTSGIVSLNGLINTYIGADRWDYNSYFDGIIDEVKVEICESVDMGAKTEEIIVSAHAAAEAEIKAPIAADKIFPNPATHTIRVHLTEDVANPNEIQVMDGFGKINRTPTRKIEDGVYEVNVSGLRKGLYFLKARTAAGLKTLKFVKL